MSRVGSICFACFLGGFIGTLVANQFHFFWWLGLIVGALIGYLSVEPKEVVSAVPKAWRAARGWHWRPAKGYWETVGYGVLSVFSVGLWSFGIFSLCIFSWPSVFPDFYLKSSDFHYLAMFFLGGVFFWSLLMGFVVALNLIGTNERELEEERRCFRGLAYYSLPPIFLFWHLPRFLVWFCRRIPTGFLATIRGLVTFARFLWRFSKELFIRIHSKERLLCAVDSAIGVCVGYLAGNAILGGLAGVAFGMLNYEIVSKRILHLVPARTKSFF